VHPAGMDAAMRIQVKVATQVEMFSSNSREVLFIGIRLITLLLALPFLLESFILNALSVKPCGTHSCFCLLLRTG
jgi:hypothetical protein